MSNTLASEQEVLELFSIRTTTQSTEAVRVALETATEMCASIIGVETFDRQSRTDRFTVDRESYVRLGRGDVIEFYLANGFLPEAYARVYQSSSNIPQTSNSTALAKSSYLIDKDKGVVSIQGRWVDSLCTVMVRYESGFDACDGIYKDVPAWLKQATISTVVEVLRTHTVTANKKDYITDMSNQLVRMFRTILYSHVRPRMPGVFPMHTEVVD